MAKNKGFCLFYDWVDRLKELDPSEAFDVIIALSDYFKEGINPVDRFSGSLKMAVGIMFDQIKRAEIKSDVLRENVNKRWNRENAKQSNAIVIQNDTNVIQADTTITETITNTITNTNSIQQQTTTYIFDTYTREEIAELYRSIREHFREEGYISDAQAFIQYNYERGWRGYGGEDALDNWLKYAKAWERKERIRHGVDVNELRGAPMLYG